MLIYGYMLLKNWNRTRISWVSVVATEFCDWLSSLMFICCWRTVMVHWPLMIFVTVITWSVISIWQAQDRSECCALCRSSVPHVWLLSRWVCLVLSVVCWFWVLCALLLVLASSATLTGWHTGCVQWHSVPTTRQKHVPSCAVFHQSTRSCRSWSVVFCSAVQWLTCLVSVLSDMSLCRLSLLIDLVVISIYGCRLC